MLAILREISITCFFTSYLVVLVLELLRLWGRIPGRGLLVVVMTGIGLFTHVCYLVFGPLTVRHGCRSVGNLVRLVVTVGTWIGDLFFCFLFATTRFRRQFLFLARGDSDDWIGRARARI